MKKFQCNNSENDENISKKYKKHLKLWFFVKILDFTFHLQNKKIPKATRVQIFNIILTLKSNINFVFDDSNWSTLIFKAYFRPERRKLLIMWFFLGSLVYAIYSFIFRSIFFMPSYNALGLPALFAILILFLVIFRRYCCFYNFPLSRFSRAFFCSLNRETQQRSAASAILKQLESAFYLVNYVFCCVREIKITSGLAGFPDLFRKRKLKNICKRTREMGKICYGPPINQIFSGQKKRKKNTKLLWKEK